MANPSSDDAARKRDRKADRKGDEKVKEYNQRYYAANREEVIARVNKYKTENTEVIKDRKRQYYAANRDKVRKYHAARSARGVYRFRHLARAHGMDGTDWAALWDVQGGRCYLCGDELDAQNARKAVVEHWHGCAAHAPEKSCRYCQRGLACARCNALIGVAGDNPAFLRRIADVLEAANRSVQERQKTAPEQLRFEM